MQGDTWTWHEVKDGERHGGQQIDAAAYPGKMNALLAKGGVRMRDHMTSHDKTRWAAQIDQWIKVTLLGNLAGGPDRCGV